MTRNEQISLIGAVVAGVEKYSPDQFDDGEILRIRFSDGRLMLVKQNPSTAEVTVELEKDGS